MYSPINAKKEHQRKIICDAEISSEKVVATSASRGADVILVRDRKHFSTEIVLPDSCHEVRLQSVEQFTQQDSAPQLLDESVFAGAVGGRLQRQVVC